MDSTTILTPLFTLLVMAAWDIVRTYWFARYTAKLTAKQMCQSAELHCKQLNQVTHLRSDVVKLLTTKTHRNSVE